MNSREIQRKQRLEKLKLLLEKAKKEKKPVDYEKLVAESILLFGITRRLAREYIDTLIKVLNGKTDWMTIEW